MKIYIFYRKMLLFLSTFLLMQLAWAQEESLMEQLFEEEQETLEAIALYPEAERNAILEAAMQPEILARLQSMQRRTQEAFRALLMPMTEAEQKIMYNLVRYPEFLHKVSATAHKQGDEEILELSQGYDEEIRQDLLWANRHHFPLLVRIAGLHQTAEQNLETLLERYPAKTRRAYQELVKLPEVVQLLTDNMNATVLLGDMYRQNPGQVKRRLDALNVEVAEQKSRELLEWKESLEEDPEAMAEYEQAAREFAEAYDYDESAYEAPIPQTHTTKVYVHHVWQPYPYWFGWPHWYAYSYWYPYPWWYHSGFYYGPQQVMVFVGLPSYTFVDWHFNHHRHYYHYPHFTNTIITYGARNPQVNNSVTRRASRWQREISQEVPRNWWANDGRRAERIRELGAFKLDYDRELRSRRDGRQTERQFLAKNAKRYPSLKPVLAERPRQESDRSREQELRTSREREKTTIRKQPQPARQTDTRSRTRVEERPRTSQEKINRAREHHENVWEKRKPATRQRTTPPPRRVAPSPRPAPQKTVQGRPDTKPKTNPRKQDQR